MRVRNSEEEGDSVGSGGWLRVHTDGCWLDKTCLNLAISRIKLLRNKREVQLINMRKEIFQYLQTGQEAIARIRVEHVIREQNILAAYEIIELFCEFILARVPILETQ
ncbi:IST protein, partial [Ananas comosus]